MQQQQQPSIVVTNFFTENRMTISLIAAGFIFLGYLLPWVTITGDERFTREMSESGITSFSGTMLLSKTWDTLTAQDTPIEGYVTFLNLLITLIASSVFFYYRFSDSNYLNKKISTISTALAICVPILYFTIYMLCVGFFRSKVILEHRTIDISLGIGAIMMFIGAVFLVYDAVLNLTIVKNTANTNKSMLAKSVVSALLYCLITYLLYKLFESATVSYSMPLFDTPPSESIKRLLVIFTVIFFIAYHIAPIALSIILHRNNDLNGKISYGRAVGTGLLTAIFIGIFAYIYVQMQDYTAHQIAKNDIPSNAVIILFIYIAQLGFIIASVAAAFLEKYDYSSIVQYTAVYTTTPVPNISLYSNPQNTIPSTDIYTQLEKLAELKTLGVLTDAEFQTQKQLILSKM